MKRDSTQTPADFLLAKNARLAASFRYCEVLPLSGTIQRYFLRRYCHRSVSRKGQIATLGVAQKGFLPGKDSSR